MAFTHKYLIIIFILSIFSKPAFAQTNVDSLELEFKKQTDLSIKAGIAASLVFETYNTLGDLKKSEYYYNFVLNNDGKKSKGRSPYAEALRNKGIINYYTNNQDSALFYFNKSLGISVEREDHYSECKAYNNIASTYYSKGDIKKALDIYILGAEKEKKYGFNEGDHISFNNIGYIYVSLKMFEKARYYFRKTISHGRINKKTSLIYAYDGLSSSFPNNRDSANYYKFKTYNLAVELNDMNSIMYASNDIANYYLEKHDYEKALHFANECIKISNNLQNKALKAYPYNTIMTVYQDQANFKLSIRYLDSVKKYINKDISPHSLIGLYRCISDNYKSVLQYDSAFFYLHKAFKLSDTLYKTELTSTLADMQTKYDFTQKEMEIETLNKINEQKQIIIYFSLIVGSIIVFLTINTLLISKKRKKLNTELQLTNHEVENKNRIIETKQKEILDSIKYARRIQQSLLPTEKYIERKLKNKS